MRAENTGVCRKLIEFLKGFKHLFSAAFKQAPTTAREQGVTWKHPHLFTVHGVFQLNHIRQVVYRVARNFKYPSDQAVHIHRVTFAYGAVDLCNPSTDRAVHWQVFCGFAQERINSPYVVHVVMGDQNTAKMVTTRIQKILN